MRWMTKQQFRDIGWALVGIGVVAFVIVQLFTAITSHQTIEAVRHTQQVGSPVLNAIADQQTEIEKGTDASVSTNLQLLDCLQPTGSCYKQARRQSSDTVASINRITYYAVACADQPGSQSLNQIQACVLAKIAAAKGHHQ